MSNHEQDNTKRTRSPVKDANGDGDGVYIAVDGGGTKTEALAFRADGTAIAKVRVPEALNPNGASGDIAPVLREIARGLGEYIPIGQVRAVFVGVAGGSDAAVQQSVRTLMKSLYPASGSVLISHDAVSALWCGSEQLPRIAMIAGTGTVAYGVNAQGCEFRVGGWGYLIGDEGSGYELGQLAVKAVMAEHDGVGQPTGLTARILSHWGVDNVRALIPIVYREGRSGLAGLAPVVCETAEKGDVVACRLVAEVAGSAADLLGHALSAAGQARESRPREVEVILIGGLWTAEVFRMAFFAELKARRLTDRVALNMPVEPPVLGAACYLMHELGLPDVSDFRARLKKTFAELGASGESSSLFFCNEFTVASSSDTAPADVPVALSALGTEASDPAWRDLDAMETASIVAIIADSNITAIRAVKHEAQAIAEAIDAVTARLASGGRLFYVGAGTSGRLGVLDAAECPPTFGVSADQVQGIIAGGESALVHPSEGAEDDEAQGGADLQARGVNAPDAVVAIAASGRTPYCIGALKQARAVGALTVSLACNKGAAFSQLADHPIEVETGAEVIAGSTRMKAGTAQKVVLNMLSTTAMIHLGKVFHGLMVDMVPSNEKLKARARRIVMQAGALTDEAAAAELLERADNEMKTAIVMARACVEPQLAREVLAASDGHVRRALTSIKTVKP